MIEAVTFDYWNTLVFEERGYLRGRRLEAWAGVLEEAGFAVERERLAAAFESSWNTFVDSWKAGGQYRAAEAIASAVPESELAPTYIVPSVFNRNVVDLVSSAVARAARADGVTRS